MIRNQAIITTLKRASGTLIFVLAIMAALAAPGFAQADDQTQAPKRGFQPSASYALSDLESINTTNGNLMLHLPLAGLPAGRGGLKAGISLFYNSKLWDKTTQYRLCPPSGGGSQTPPTPECTGDAEGRIRTQLVTKSLTGGWTYGYKYSLKNDDRNYTPPPHDTTLDPPYQGSFNFCGDVNSMYYYRMKIVLPDGGEHLLRLQGSTDGDGFADYNSNGQSNSWCTNYPAWNGGPTMTYYTTDGSYLRLVKKINPTGSDVVWTLYQPDGSRVTLDVAGVQRVYDRNDNFIQIEEIDNYNGTGHKATRLSDQLGREIVIEKDATSDKDYIHATGFNGEALTTVVQWKTIDIIRAYSAMTGIIMNTGAGLHLRQRVVDTITLPTQTGGLGYEFGYNATTGTTPSIGWGELSKIILPSGAKAEYEYTWDAASTTPGAEDVIRDAVKKKTLTYARGCDDGCDPAIETTTYAIDQEGGQSIITGPDGGITTQYFSGDNGGGVGPVYKTMGPDGTVTEQFWANNIPAGIYGSGHNPYVKTTFTSIRDKSGALIKTAVQNLTFDKNGNVIQKDDYDYVNYSSILRNGSGNPTGSLAGLTPARKTVTEYVNKTNYAGSSTETGNEYYALNAPALRGLPAWTEVRDSSNNPKTRAEFYYDGAVAYATAPTHGNVTQQLVWDNYKGGTVQNWSNPLSSANANIVQTQYDSYGNPTLITDPKNNQTLITYAAVAGAGTDNLYPTETKTAYSTGIQQTKRAYYDLSSGAVVKTTDVDRGVDTLSTYDVFGRPTLVKAAAGTTLENRTSMTYDDLARRVITRGDLNVTGDGKLVQIQHYDQLGRPWLSRMLEDAASQGADNLAAGIKVQTRYGFVNDGSGHYSYQITSNPYRANTATNATNEPTMGWSRSLSQADGSRSESETFAGVTVPLPGATLTSTGKVVTWRDGVNTYVRDQADKWRMSTSNALGQMVSVTEDPTASFTGYSHTGTNLVTNYNYDTLSNLTHVGQGGQSRDFTYSTIGRLISAANPESGTIAYKYDANGNLTSKTDARLTTNYTYDQLNRPVTRTYSDGTTPAVSYTYYSGAVSPNNGSLASVSSTVSTTTYTGYDILGRVTGSQQTTDGQTYAMTYGYNLAGALTDETYPSGRIVHHNYGVDGKLTAVSSRLAANKPSKSYAQNFSYNAAGAVASMQLGNMRWESTTFNSRMQPTQIALGTTPTGTSATDMLQLNYAYDDGTNLNRNNGNVIAQQISVRNVGATPGFVANQSYTYDELNRLKSATEMSTPNGGTAAESWKQTYQYDRFGNRTFDAAGTTTFPTNFIAAVHNPTISDANNQFNTGQGYLYDAAGNVNQDAEGRKFVYDGENKQASFGVGGSTTNGGTYVYDGDGRRVKKVVAGEMTIFVYNAAGQMMAEYATTPPSSPQISYLTSDGLGTSRINTNANGEIIARHDYMPFGEEILSAGDRNPPLSYTPDNIRQKYTRKERDSETGLDYFGARYFSSALGRFTSPDPLMASAYTQNPQSWNRYTYALNNPLKYVDPDGMKPVFRAFKDLTDDERRILNNSTLTFGKGKKTKTLSGEALYDHMKEKEKKQLAGFLNMTAGLSDLKFSDGSRGIDYVKSITGGTQERIYANVDPKLKTQMDTISSKGPTKENRFIGPGGQAVDHANAGIQYDVSFRENLADGPMQLSFSTAEGFTRMDMDMDEHCQNCDDLGARAAHIVDGARHKIPWVGGSNPEYIHRKLTERKINPSYTIGK